MTPNFIAVLTTTSNASFLRETYPLVHVSTTTSPPCTAGFHLETSCAITNNWTLCYQLFDFPKARVSDKIEVPDKISHSLEECACQQARPHVKLKLIFLRNNELMGLYGNIIYRQGDQRRTFVFKRKSGKCIDSVKCVAKLIPPKGKSYFHNSTNTSFAFFSLLLLCADRRIFTEVNKVKSYHIIKCTLVETMFSLA